MNTKKGRPKKKPTYSEEMIMQELLSAISDAYLTGGNGKGETSPPAVSLRQVANEFDITLMKTRKLLITAGVYHTEISDEVNELKAEGSLLNMLDRADEPEVIEEILRDCSDLRGSNEFNLDQRYDDISLPAELVVVTDSEKYGKSKKQISPEVLMNRRLFAE